MTNEEYRAMIEREDKAKRDLAFALVSRVLTDEEMGRVADLGICLYTQVGVPFRESDLHVRLNAALLQQFKLRGMAAHWAKPVSVSQDFGGCYY